MASWRYSEDEKYKASIADMIRYYNEIMSDVDKLESRKAGKVWEETFEGDVNEFRRCMGQIYDVIKLLKNLGDTT